eukprot:9030962-Karenia_brevis.AAC.1
MHDLQCRDGVLQCVACNKSAARARWTNLAYGTCSANIGQQAVLWTREPHQHVEAGGRIVCLRCSGSVPSHRRTSFVGKRCPAWRA